MKRWFPWLMAVTGMIVLLVSNGLTATALSVYDESLLNEFGWTRGELKFRDLVTFWLVALIAPFAGVFIDKLGPRRMLAFGCVMISIGYLLYSRLDSLGMLYAIHVILALGLLGASTMTCVILISSWFYKQRGLAIGIALVGTSLGSILLSPVNALLIERVGWRRAFEIEAAIPIVLMVFVLLVVRNSPRDIGAVAHGLDTGAGRDLRQEGLTLAEAMHPLTLMAVGVYGKELPNQNGAPLRLVIPWKYGFKGIKSIVGIEFTQRQPRTSWNLSAPDEYGFYANVNPEVDHPRWSQKRERRIGSGAFWDRQPTQMFNGYADQVASLYRGLDLARNF